MQNTSCQVNKKNIISADVPFDSVQTFFSSEFYDFNNESSQMEDFDISKQYLKSQFSDRSMILRQYSQQSFLKALEVYYRYSCSQSFQLWRTINSIQKRKDRLKNTETVTVVFLKIFYLFNKKFRSILEKSLLKIVNFTKTNDMKTYETPTFKGLKRLAQTVETLNSKYFFDSSINKQRMIKQCFREIRILSHAVINRVRIQNLALIVQKMVNFNYFQNFAHKIEQLNMTKEKLDILVGTLSLVVNPLKRSFMCELKQTGMKKKLPRFDYGKNQILDDEFLNQQNLEIQKQFNFKKSEYFTQDFNCGAFQKIQQQQNQFVAGKSTISQSIDSVFVQKPQIIQKNGQKDVQLGTAVKNPLKFSKQLQRKSSTCDKPNKLKFKSVPSSNTPKKMAQSNYLDQHLGPHPILNDSLQNKPPHQQNNILTACHQSRLCLKNIVQNSRTLSNCIKFEKSLNFTEKSQRKITLNQKTEKLSHRKPDQPSFGVPDYSNFYAHPCISIQALRNQANNLLTQSQNQNKLTISNQNKLTIFKTIKSGKPLNSYGSYQSMTNLNEAPGRSLKPSAKFTYNQMTSDWKFPPNLLNLEKAKNIIPLVFSQNGTFSPSKTLQNSRSDKVINFKCIQRLKSESSSSLQNFKNQYRFPINYATHANKKCQNTQRLDLNTKSIQFMKEYGNNTHRNNFQSKQKMERQSYKSSSLAFKSKRPMKTVKSPNRQFQSGIKNTQLKRQKKSSEKDAYLKPKKSKQIKSDFLQSKYKVLSDYSKGQNLTVLSIQSGKSNNPSGVPKSPPHRSSGVKLVGKK